MFQVDAFTNKPFHGNPAGVCLLDAKPEDTWLQAVAAEMNLSETAFVWREDTWKIRYFTPLVEVPLCGHATLSSGHVLWEKGLAEPGEAIRFHSPSGLLTLVREKDWICMDLPADIPTRPRTIPPLEDLGARPVHIMQTRFCGYLIELEDAEAVRHYNPDLQKLLKQGWVEWIVTASGQEEADFVSRFFAPGLGIPEDPVTGSAHCSLAPYWSQRLNKSSLTAHQLSKRFGTVRMRTGKKRVAILGQAVTVFQGEWVP